MAASHNGNMRVVSCLILRSLRSDSLRIKFFFNCLKLCYFNNILWLNKNLSNCFIPLSSPVHLKAEQVGRLAAVVRSFARSVAVACFVLVVLLLVPDVLSLLLVTSERKSCLVSRGCSYINV